MARAKIQKVLKALLEPGYKGCGEVSEFKIRAGSDEVGVLVSGTTEFGHILLLSPGFASSLTDYGPLVEFFEQDHLVVRVRHRGSTRFSGLQALLRLLWARIVLGKTATGAAQFARHWIHRLSNRERRLDHLSAVAERMRSTHPDCTLSVAGHSFGTDTVLRWSSENECENLYLFSPHPPGYLLQRATYTQLRAEKIWLVVGSEDRTRDGVGPEDRLQVAEVLDEQKLKRTLILDGVRHMDFAFPGWGPQGWQKELRHLVVPAV